MIDSKKNRNLINMKDRIIGAILAIIVLVNLVLCIRKPDAIMIALTVAQIICLIGYVRIIYLKRTHKQEATAFEHLQSALKELHSQSK